MDEFKNLKRVAMSELRKLDAQYANKEEFSESDAKKYDCLMHSLKSHLTVEGMIDAKEAMEGEWDPDAGNSGRRGRAANGRYVSMDGHMPQTSFSDGFSQGYAEAMNRYSETAGNGMSGHYPFMYPQRRW